MIKDIIKQYRNFCESKGWIQEQAAAELGCSRSHLSKIFSGTRNPSMKILEQMEKIMKKYNYKK